MRRSFLSSLCCKIESRFEAADLCARLSHPSGNIKRRLTGGVFLDASFSLMEGHLCFQYALSRLVAIPTNDLVSAKERSASSKRLQICNATAVESAFELRSRPFVVHDEDFGRYNA